MDQTEIDQWNRSLSGGKLLPVSGDNQQQQQQQQQQLLQQQGVEAQRAMAIEAIKLSAQQQEEREKQQQQKLQQQQGWVSRLLGLHEKTENTKTKKLPLFFDK
ncbi:uncharacterized protein EMH_0070250 [Eimeria mitis]|uniref:Uncharacterized protein n=1 Tax=Eimeria mitis TaxID=44415 RepID=U6K2B4_9EIME|nr:uncharacterized protein EMH_0070250 [Eimeria mitis]CDJ31845.1 hypothetical protein, conserved [Eimeria mitis]